MTDRIKSYLDQLSVGLKRPTALAPGNSVQKEKAPKKGKGRPPAREYAWRRELRRDPMAWTNITANRQWTMRVRQFAQLQVRVILALAALDGPATERQVRQVMRYWRGDVGNRLDRLMPKGIVARVSPGRYVLTERGLAIAGLVG